MCWRPSQSIVRVVRIFARSRDLLTDASLLGPTRSRGWWIAAQIHQHAGQQIDARNNARQIGVVIDTVGATAKNRDAVDARRAGFRREGYIGGGANRDTS